MKTIGAYLAVAVLCGTLGYSSRNGLAWDPESGSSWLGGGSQSKPVPRPVQVTALGRLEPRSGLVSLAGPMGTRLEKIEVAEGDLVKKGQVLARLDGRAELLAQEAQLDAQIREAQTRLDAERRYKAVLVAEGQLQRRQLSELGPRTLAMQQAKIDLLTKSLENARRNFDRLRALANGRGISQQEIDAAQVAATRAQEELHAAEIERDKLRKEQELDDEKLDIEILKGEVGADRIEAAIPLDSLRASLALVRARLEQLEIKAPIDGRVLKILAHEGESAGGRPILELGDDSAMVVVAEVYETDRKRIHEGQRAQVTSPAFPAGHARLYGVVERIGRIVAKKDVLGLDPASDAYSRVVEVRIRLDEADGGVAKPHTNLQVDVAIDTPNASVARGPEARR